MAVVQELDTFIMRVRACSCRIPDCRWSEADDDSTPRIVDVSTDGGECW